MSAARPAAEVRNLLLLRVVAVSRGQGIVAKGASAIGNGARKAAGVLPASAVDWSGTALGSLQRTLAKVSRAGLSRAQ
ncbi:hypothetical protein JCM9533A_77750 [Catenuloplanes niger JCM 9533]